MAVLYFLIGLGATIFGALAGLGGGVIIKPAVDFVGDYDVGSIGILSAATVFAMSCVSLMNSAKQNVRINVKSSLSLAIGSIIGGILGKLSFNHLLESITNADMVTVIQASMIAVLMCCSYI